MDQPRTELARELYRIGAVKISKSREEYFPLKSGGFSPIYFNLRTSLNPKPGPLTNGSMSQLARAMKQLISHDQIDFHGLAPVPNAGYPIALAIGNTYRPDNIPIAVMRKEDYPDGKRKITKLDFEIGVKPGSRLLLVDDVISNAASKLEAVEVLRSAGYMVEDAVVVVDRQQGGQEHLASHHLRLHAVFTLSELLDFYQAEGCISEQKVQEVRTYIMESLLH